MQYYPKYIELTQDKYIFTYTGPIDFQEVIHWKELIDKVLRLEKVENKQRRSLINILIEGLQNIHRHGDLVYDSDKKSITTCLILLKKELTTYNLIFGNYIKNNEIKGLEEILENLNKINMKELKSLYLKTIEKGEISSKGGAGLGLIKMHLESAQNTSYHFQVINEANSFFTIEFKVSVNQ